MGIFGDVLKAVAGPLVGGLFGSGKAKAEGVDYVKLRDDAQAAGFNPLTALLAGGGAGYQRQFNPALSSGAFIAEAVDRAVDTVFNRPSGPDPVVSQARVRELTRSANDARAVSRPPGSFGFALTDQRPFGAERTLHQPAISSRASTDAAPPAPSDDSVTPAKRPIISFGQELRPSGKFSDAAAWEDRYGDGSPIGFLHNRASELFDLGQSVGYAVDRARFGPVMSVGGKRYALQPSKRGGGPVYDAFVDSAARLSAAQAARLRPKGARAKPPPGWVRPK